VFGIGGQELVIVGLLFLVLFGPVKVGEVARDLGRFTSKARASIEELKTELTLVEDQNRESPGLPKHLPKQNRESPGLPKYKKP
jgi:sec-independent protein translocase protein TatB